MITYTIEEKRLVEELRIAEELRNKETAASSEANARKRKFKEALFGPQQEPNKPLEIEFYK